MRYCHHWEVITMITKTPKQLLKHFHKMKEYVLKEWKENSLNKLQVSNVNKEI